VAEMAGADFGVEFWEVAAAVAANVHDLWSQNFGLLWYNTFF